MGSYCWCRVRLSVVSYCVGSLVVSRYAGLSIVVLCGFLVVCCAFALFPPRACVVLLGASCKASWLLFVGTYGWGWMSKWGFGTFHMGGKWGVGVLFGRRS